MTEQQVATPTKKRTTAKAASTVAGKPIVTSKSKTAKSATVTTAKKSTAKKPVAKKTTSAKAKPASTEKKAKPTPEERYRMVETAAYFIAEQHGFQGRSDEHWAAAEREIAAKLGK